MKDKNVRKAILNTSAIFLLVIGVMLYFYIKDPDRNYLYYQTKQYENVVVATKGILPGEEINDDNIKVVEVEVTELLINDLLFCKSVDELIGKKALYPIKVGQLLQNDYLLEKEKWLEGKHEYAIEVNIPGTVANSIKIGDFIDVNISYDKTLSLEDLYDSNVFYNFDIVIPKVQVENMKNSEGLSYEDFLKENNEENFVPTYVILNLEYMQIDDYIGAEKIGKIFLIKYGDITTEANIKTFNKTDNNGFNVLNDVNDETDSDLESFDNNDDLDGE